jgi:glycosyltransferase involved in cell wall biosynthesis
MKVVVDDGSKDRTGEIARIHGAYVIRHLTNLGVGAATITGLRSAADLDVDVIVTMDSDGQHDPAEIEKLVETLIDGRFDVVRNSPGWNWQHTVADNQHVNRADLLRVARRNHLVGFYCGVAAPGS